MPAKALTCAVVGLEGAIVEVDGMRVFPVGTLAELVNHLRGDVLIREYVPDARALDDLTEFTSAMVHVPVQEHVKRALEVAAAGKHNVFIFTFGIQRQHSVLV